MKGWTQENSKAALVMTKFCLGFCSHYCYHLLLQHCAHQAHIHYQMRSFHQSHPPNPLLFLKIFASLTRKLILFNNIVQHCCPQDYSDQYLCSDLLMVVYLPPLPLTSQLQTHREKVLFIYYCISHRENVR